jgi:hypothetical protein
MQNVQSKFPDNARCSPLKIATNRIRKADQNAIIYCNLRKQKSHSIAVYWVFMEIFVLLMMHANWFLAVDLGLIEAGVWRFKFMRCEFVFSVLWLEF